MVKNGTGLVWVMHNYCYTCMANINTDVLEMFPGEEVGSIRQAIWQKLSDSTKITERYKVA